MRSKPMYPFLHNLLSDKKGGEIFMCFGLCYFVYIAIAALTFVTVFLLLRGRDKSAKDKVMLTLINISFGLYILDFFLMPFVNIGLFFGVEMLIYLIIMKTKREIE